MMERKMQVLMERLYRNWLLSKVVKELRFGKKSMMVAKNLMSMYKLSYRCFQN